MNPIPALSSCRSLEELFLGDPQGTVDRLVSRKALKGNSLSALRKTLLETLSDPNMAQWLWLLLSPRILSVMITQDRCNLACRMCGGARGPLKYLDAERFRRILRHVPTTDLVTLVAGNSEPLLSPVMPDVLRCARDEGVNLDIVTNGHLLSPELIRTMVETGRPTGLSISIDAARSDTYKTIRGASLERLIDNLENLREQKTAAGSEVPKVSLLMVGMTDNIEELADLVLLAGRLNAYRVHVDHLKGNYSPGDFTANPRWQTFISAAREAAKASNVELQTPSDAVVSRSAPKLNYCSWLESAQIGITGNLSPCCHNPRVLGNIFEKHISQQTDYLRYRMRNMEGNVERFCLGAKNCAYVEELRAFKRVPGTFV